MSNKIVKEHCPRKFTLKSLCFDISVHGRFCTSEDVDYLRRLCSLFGFSFDGFPVDPQGGDFLDLVFRTDIYPHCGCPEFELIISPLK